MSQDCSKSTELKNSNNLNKWTYKCNRCNQIGHFKSHCFELIRYLGWWDLTQNQNSKRLFTTLMLAQTKENNMSFQQHQHW